jgi:hypothetical protein
MTTQKNNNNNTMEEKEYLSVSFQEKDNAKSLGAKWDMEKKKWYIPLHINEKNKLELQEKYKVNNQQILYLIGEDRTFGGDELFVDLIPSSCWFSNVRYCIHPSDWDRVRKYIYERVNYICECCGINTKENNVQLDAHERWFYDDETYTQKLVRIVALCSDCHQSTHIGYAKIKGKEKEAIMHLQKVRNMTDEECHAHITEAYKIWNFRNKIDWNLDISLIENNHIKIANHIETKERQNFSSKKLETIEKKT